jgi:poly(A) polymerase
MDMLKRLVARLTNRKRLKTESAPNAQSAHGSNSSKSNCSHKNPDLVIIERANHCISRANIADSALKVLYRLRKAGFEAYLVGGGVRDLLLGLKPKDFDVTTSAKPEQVKALFGNSRLIGKRFKLVHVVFGREVIEVATFRATPNESSQHHTQSDQGMLTRDNVYGNKDEDALRRDFTVNALYYSINDFSIHSYYNALEDLKTKQLSIIGHPETRYREDPVRMLRAARFAAKLNFEIGAETLQPIKSMGHLLKNISHARLYEEVLKLFVSGHAVASFNKLQSLGLLHHIFPGLDYELQTHPQWQRFILCAFANTDSRINEDKPVNPAYLFAALMWPSLQRSRAQYESQGMPAIAAMHQAASTVIHNQHAHTAIPKRFSSVTKEIWDLQLRLPKASAKKAENLIEHPKFRAGYDFLLLRESVGEDLKGSGTWWTHYLETNPKAIALFAQRQYPARREYSRLAEQETSRGRQHSQPQVADVDHKTASRKRRRPKKRRVSYDDTFKPRSK